MRGIIFIVFLGWLFSIAPCTLIAGTSTGPGGAKSELSPADPGSMVSAYARFNSAAEETMFDIPADKHFVLTDIIGMASIVIKQDDITKLNVQIGHSPDKSTRYPSSISLRTGIVFSPGAKVIVFPYPVGIGLDSSYGYVTLSGYYF